MELEQEKNKQSSSGNTLSSTRTAREEAMSPHRLAEGHEERDLIESVTDTGINFCPKTVVYFFTIQDFRKENSRSPGFV